ncbi:MAG: PIN domain-containing protein [Bacteroidia bacterium]|jgi:predicted nucleic acid-binding protein
MKLFLDANILVSVLNKEYPVFSYSSRILSLADQKPFRLYTSAICLAIAYYFSEKKSGRVLAGKKMELLCSKINICPSNGETVQATLANKKIKDFEDGLEYYAALHSKCDCILTENESDYYFSAIEVMNSMRFIEKYFRQ